MLTVLNVVVDERFSFLASCYALFSIQCGGVGWGVKRGAGAEGLRETDRQTEKTERGLVPERSRLDWAVRYLGQISSLARQEPKSPL